MRNYKIISEILFFVLLSLPVKCQVKQQEEVVTLSLPTIDSLYESANSLYNRGKYQEYVRIINTLTIHYEKENNLTKIYELQLRLADVNRAAQNFDYTIQILNILLDEVPWNNKKLRAEVYDLKGATYFEMNLLDDAIWNSKTALSISKSINDQKLIAGSYNVLGAVYRTINTDSAIWFLQNAISTWNGIEDTVNVALAYYNLANTFNTIQQYDSSLKYSIKSLEISRKHGIPTYQILALNNLVSTHIDLKNYKLALEIMAKRDSLELEIISTKNAVRINQLMEKLEEEKEAQERNDLLARIELNKKLDARKNLILVFSILAVILLTIFSFIIWRKNSQRKKDLLQMEELNKNVKEYSNKMTELNNSKDKIFSIISHDLRSPFSQLITFLSFADDGELSENDMKIIYRDMLISSKNGLQMLDNLLHWANSNRDGQKPVKREFHIAESLKDSVIEAEYLAKHKSVKVKINCPLQLTINADRVLFEIVIRNLLSNAIKFSPENSEVLITVLEKDGMIRTEITDNGEGIPAEIIKALEKNSLDYSSSHGTKGEKGAGMGLYLSSEFARQNNGTLQFELQKQGTKAVFTLPIS
ncbi:MAG: hypothetical protein CL840_07245 [Crocinitomicaceae bacterium]|nr:hypothetical protein [Crocinitomicaceae bacterium]|tara:strand:- start:15262 stop:17028 length:1767 start_codon:yes stop_codon:yes gene_type:complete